MGVRPLIRRTRVVFRRMSMEENDDISLDQAENPDTKVRPIPSYGSSAVCGEVPDGNAQNGVQDVEAVTMVWSKKTLIAVFIKYVHCGFDLSCARFYYFQEWLILDFI
jgi:hypothetical protein